ncbi:PAS domain S-box protein [Acidovorax sp. RAC01]|uniref:PAS domain S-box protein n=1 Tax=Acidovorax sp. RAC01 TaxID=1842533 RepID=UPI0018D42C9A|nr:PAS domain S-box protein [Acidovorax sp. RAC01]
MKNLDDISVLPTEDEDLADLEQGQRSGWRAAWESSLKFRLLALGMMPLLLAFPLVMAALSILGGNRAEEMLLANLRSQLGASASYLEQTRRQTGNQLGQLARSERMRSLLRSGGDPQNVQRVLAEAADSSNLDYLLIIREDGHILATHSGHSAGMQLPPDHVVEQAREGVFTAAFERFGPDVLALLGKGLQNAALVPLHADENGGHSGDGGSRAAEDRGLAIHAAAHFPLSVDSPNAMLVGGILLNRNAPLMEHMRELVYPVGTLPDGTEGIALLTIGDTIVALSRQRQDGGRLTGSSLPAEPASALANGAKQWSGRTYFGDARFMMGVEALKDIHDDEPLGTVSVAFPYAPYERAIRLLLWAVGGVLAVTMLVVSLSYLVAGREITGRLGTIRRAMSRVRRGDRSARVATRPRQDELELLARHFNVLLDTISAQDDAQKRAQKTIADEASRRRALFEHERDGVIILNEDGTVFEANPSAARMLGYTTEELRGMHASAWEARFNAAEIADNIRTARKEGETIETVHRRKDGSTYVAELTLGKVQWGDHTFILTSQRDISERKAVQAELDSYHLNLEMLVEQRTRDLNDRTVQLDTIFALSPDGMVSFDLQGRVASVNQAFLQMTGLERSGVEHLDEHAFEAVLRKLCRDPATFTGFETLRSGVAPGLADPRLVLEISGPGERILEMRLKSSGSDFISQVLYVRDITRESEVDRMKSEFLSTAAHELRTPMASIAGFTELLLLRKFPEEKQRDLLETISRQAGRMSTIINELLDLARIEARRGQDFVMETLAVQDVVRLVAHDFSPPLGRDKPTLLVNGAAVHVRADRGKLQQALLNVLSNAYKYSPGGGDVIIDCAMDDDGQHVAVTLRDHGMGMSAEQLQQVFERFYRADTSGHIPGTGLGMSIVKEIVEIMGGQVSVSSELGVGTAVTLRLPVVAVVAGTQS